MKKKSQFVNQIAEKERGKDWEINPNTPLSQQGKNQILKISYMPSENFAIPQKMSEFIELYPNPGLS